MVADGARGAPRGEFAERSQLRDPGGDATPIVRGQRDIAPHRQLLQVVLAQREGEPPGCTLVDREDRLADRNDLAQFGDQDADRAVDRRHKPGLVELGLQVGHRRFGQRDPGIGQRALLGDRAGARSRMLGALEVEIGLRLGQRGGALVELLTAGEILGRQRNGTGVLLLGQQQVGLGRSHACRPGWRPPRHGRRNRPGPARPGR